MTRLRQQYPQNYRTSGNISVEFENVIRYINAAERGNKTVGELLESIFDDSGAFSGPIQFRLDSVSGLEWRIGEYTDPELGWTSIADIDEIRGPSGTNVGQIAGPLFYNRLEAIATAGQTVFPYSFDSETDSVMVYVNGILQADNNLIYTTDSANNEITFASGLNLDDDVTIISVRTQQVANYRRVDLISASAQAVFPFVHEPTEQFLVFKNGIIQRSGGAYDYTSSPDSDTVTFTTPCLSGDLITIITVDNSSLSNVGGLMLEDEYTDPNGLILYNKLSINDDQIPQSKVNGLAPSLLSKAKITQSATAPVSPSVTDLWLDTSVTPNRLKFYDGTQWILTSPDSTLPSFIVTDALKYVRVNASGTALEYGTIDFSTLVPKTYIGAANGVASLDSAGKLPVEQLPQTFSAQTLFKYNAGATANATYLITRIYRQKIRIDGISYKSGAGTCTIQIAVDGVGVGGTYAVSTTNVDSNLGTTIEVDATTASKRIQIIVTSQASLSDLEVALSTTTVTV